MSILPNSPLRILILSISVCLKYLAELSPKTTDAILIYAQFVHTYNWIVYILCCILFFVKYLHAWKLWSLIIYLCIVTYTFYIVLSLHKMKTRFFALYHATFYLCIYISLEPPISLTTLFTISSTDVHAVFLPSYMYPVLNLLVTMYTNTIMMQYALSYTFMQYIIRTIKYSSLKYSIF